MTSNHSGPMWLGTLASVESYCHHSSWLNPYQGLGTCYQLEANHVPQTGLGEKSHCVLIQGAFSIIHFVPHSPVAKSVGQRATEGCSNESGLCQREEAVEKEERPDPLPHIAQVAFKSAHANILNPLQKDMTSNSANTKHTKRIACIRECHTFNGR